jgi:Holliday junction resolvase-like predicted endonuclease
MKMIALVSDQRMQNVFPILQAGAHYDELILVLSKERRTGQPLPRFLQAADDLTEALHSRVKVSLCTDCIDPFNIEETATAISALIQQAGGQTDVLVNISGGTKPMAIGALRAAQAASVTSLYTDTEDNELIRLFANGSIETEQIQVEDLKVPIYIRAYGETIVTAQETKKLSTTQMLWAKTIGEHYEAIYQQVIVPVTSAIKIAKGIYPVICTLSPTRRQQSIIEQLAQQGLWEWHAGIGSGQIFITGGPTAHFLNGGWVEILAAIKLQASGFFDDVLLNVTLKGVEGEIDVAAVSNGRLVLIECKSNVQRTEQLSKLDNFRRRLGGPFAQAYYARASDAYQSQILQQCQKLRLDGVFFGAQLREIGVKIGEKI